MYCYFIWVFVLHTCYSKLYNVSLKAHITNCILVEEYKRKLNELSRAPGNKTIKNNSYTSISIKIRTIFVCFLLFCLTLLSVF